jgi:hypothetical protein
MCCIDQLNWQSILFTLKRPTLPNRWQGFSLEIEINSQDTADLPSNI